MAQSSMATTETTASKAHVSKAEAKERIDISNDNWKFRRRVVFSTLAFCALAVGYLIVKGNDQSTLQWNIAMGLIILAASVIGSYVFGAVWDDKIIDKFRK